MPGVSMRHPAVWTAQTETDKDEDVNRRKILIIDDEDHILQMLRMNMKTQGYDSITAYTGEEGLVLTRKEAPDLILLDVMLPGIDGVETCRRLKDDPLTRRIPVIMLSAKSQGQDKIDGLLGGADDYITKPFSLQELFLRINAALRQVDLLTAVSNGVLSVGSLALDTEKYQVSTGGGKIDLTLTEFRILHLLMKTPGAVVNREAMIQEIFDKDPAEMGRTLDVHVRNIRKKMEAHSVDRCEIETIRGTGFRITETK